MKRRRTWSRAAFLAAALAAALFPTAAGAEGGEAQRLFNEGRDALKRGDRAVACVRFRGSLDLARVANTLFNVAQCDEHDGKLVAALRGWREGVLLLGPGDERLAVAKERLGALEAKVPKVTLILAADLPAEAHILVDGATIERPAVGTSLPLDPGEHAIVVEAPGRKAQRTDVRLAERDRKEVALAAGPPEVAAPPVATRPPPPPPPPGSGTRRTAGFVIGGLGLAGMAAFALTGGVLLDRDGQIRTACPDKVCSPRGRELIDGNPPLLIANAAALGVGLAGIALGTVLVVTGGREQEARAGLVPVVLPGGGGGALVGRF